MQCSVGVQCSPSLRTAAATAFLIYSVHFQSLFSVHPGAETHTRTEAPTVAANWTDSLAIDLLQVSVGSLCKIQFDRFSHSFNLALLCPLILPTRLLFPP